MSAPCPVVHFEMPYEDRQRMAEGNRAGMLQPIPR
jgi:hypothetical protein